MRCLRIKPLGIDTYYHIYNRIAGTRKDRPLGDVEKAHFQALARRLLQLYTVEVFALTVMGNHFHLLLLAPGQPPDPETAAARYATYYGGKRTLSPGSKACQRAAERMRDISAFMAELQYQFTCWFNRTRKVRRRGSLWAGRFKHTLLEPGLAVWNCWSYLELNPVRAGLVQDPADYRFCSYGQWIGSGRHPFAEAVKTHLLPSLAGILQVLDLEDLQATLRRTLAERLAAGCAQPAMRVGEPLPFLPMVARRMRYWNDGIVIGTKGFVLQLVTGLRGLRTDSPLAPEAVPAPKLYAYRRLRVLQD